MLNLEFPNAPKTKTETTLQRSIKIKYPNNGFNIKHKYKFNRRNI